MAGRLILADVLQPIGGYMKLSLILLMFAAFYIGSCSYPQLNDYIPPSSRVIFPYEGAVISDNITIILDAADDDKVDKVWIYVDGEKIGETSSQPYTIPFNISGYEKKVNHVIQAAAEDKSGNVGYSPLSRFVIAETNDNIDPFVTIVNPQSGQVVEGIVNIVAHAEDERSIQKVAFFINGDSVGFTSDYPYMYNWNTSGLSDSTEHTIFAKAFDGGNNIAVSPVIRVTVYPRTREAADIIAPRALFLYPIAGSIVTGTVRVSVDLQDNVGVTKAEFFVDGALTNSAENPASPWIFSWNTTAQADTAAHSIYVKAYDAAGNVGTTGLTVVTVQ